METALRRAAKYVGHRRDIEQNLRNKAASSSSAAEATKDDDDDPRFAHPVSDDVWFCSNSLFLATRFMET